MTPISIPVGMYHHVNRNAGDHITVSVENFRRQMEWLRREKYETLDAAAYLAALYGKYRPARRCFVITFDDAWLDVYQHAFPILKSFGHKFIVFVVSNWTEQATRSSAAGRDGVFPPHAFARERVAAGLAAEVICAWRHLREMQESGLASIENHTASHRDATQLTQDELREDLLRCRKAIRERLGGREGRHLCWPFGQHNSNALRLARELGFETTYLVRRGVNLAGGRSFATKRFTIADRDEKWLRKHLAIFSNPLAGYLFARLKPDRWFRKPDRRGSGALMEML
jgi:peptidoglycan/xylan/chitin deacetylase (PgdA/CDA1 family)